jgi:outer membrane protein assembly factor BamB
VPYFDEGGDGRVLLIANGLHLTAFTGETGGYYFSETIALDATTGAELWRLPGTGNGWPATGTVLLEDKDHDGVGTAGLRLVRLADGATIWNRETPGAQRWVMLGAEPGHPDRVATVDGDGDVRVLRLADGTEAAHGTVDWHPDSPEKGDFTDLVAEADGLYVLHASGNRATATAYSDSTLQRLWTATQTSGTGQFYPCGAVLCAVSTGELLAYDWTTGALRWRAVGHTYARAAGHDLLIAEDRAEPARRTLLDASTGRRIADLGTAQPPWDYGGGALITIDVSPSQVGRAVVRWVNPRTGETLVLGTMDPVNGRTCRIAGRLLFCIGIGSRLRVIAAG